MTTTQRTRNLLTAARDGNLLVQAFGEGVPMRAALHVTEGATGYTMRADRYVPELIEQGLIAKPRYTRYAKPAKLTKAGQAELTRLESDCPVR